MDEKLSMTKIKIISTIFKFNAKIFSIYRRTDPISKDDDKQTKKKS